MTLTTSDSRKQSPTTSRVSCACPYEGMTTAPCPFSTKVDFTYSQRALQQLLDARNEYTSPASDLQHRPETSGPFPRDQSDGREGEKNPQLAPRMSQKRWPAEVPLVAPVRPPLIRSR